MPLMWGIDSIGTMFHLSKIWLLREVEEFAFHMWLSFSDGVENEGDHRLDFLGYPNFLENLEVSGLGA